jgi:hypothetical protein
VYGTADSVVLKINGIQIGPARTSTDHIFSWPGTTLSRGANLIEVVGTRGGVTYTDTATWTLR